METEESLLWLQGIATGPYPKSLETSPDSNNLLIYGKSENYSPAYIKFSAYSRWKKTLWQSILVPVGSVRFTLLIRQQQASTELKPIPSNRGTITILIYIINLW
jgi:hypothetical protein